MRGVPTDTIYQLMGDEIAIRSKGKVLQQLNKAAVYLS